MAKKKRSSRSKRQAAARFPSLKFNWAGDPLSAATISYFDFLLNFPDDFKRFLRKSNGGTPDRADFTWQHPGRGPQESHVDRFFGIDTRPFGPDRGVDCIGAIVRFRDCLPQYCIPIAFVDRDDLLLTFVSGARAGQVWLKLGVPPLVGEEHDREEGLYFVADSFAAFLNLLTKPEDEYSPATFALDSPKVRGKQLEALLKSLGCKTFKYKGVLYSQTAPPPAWEWPKYKRSQADDPAFLSVEKNHTLGHASKFDERPKGHKMLRVDVTKSQRTSCLKELAEALGDAAVRLS